MIDRDTLIKEIIEEVEKSFVDDSNHALDSMKSPIEEFYKGNQLLREAAKENLIREINRISRVFNGGREFEDAEQDTLLTYGYWHVLAFLLYEFTRHRVLLRGAPPNILAVIGSVDSWHRYLGRMLTSRLKKTKNT